MPELLMWWIYIGNQISACQSNSIGIRWNDGNYVHCVNCLLIALLLLLMSIAGRGSRIVQLGDPLNQTNTSMQFRAIVIGADRWQLSRQERICHIFKIHIVSFSKAKTVMPYGKISTFRIVPKTCNHDSHLLGEPTSTLPTDSRVPFHLILGFRYFHSLSQTSRLIHAKALFKNKNNASKGNIYLLPLHDRASFQIKHLLASLVRMLK